MTDAKKYDFDEKHNQYLVRSVNSHEQGEWFYCIGCEMKWVKPYNHHINCPRSKEESE